MKPHRRKDELLLDGAFAATPLDRKSLPRSRLDIAKRLRTNRFPWTGQFSPQLVEALLETYAPASGTVLDPFAGSGTSLVEAVRFGLSAHGNELNPAGTRCFAVTGTILGPRSKRCCVTMSGLTSHGEKFQALAENDKLPPSDRLRVWTAITKHEARICL